MVERFGNIVSPEQYDKISQGWEEKNLEKAEAVRNSAVYRFKREFFLTPGRDLLAPDIEKTLSGIVNHLYPPVTKDNVLDYINRAW